jgi:hypothetical protein
VRNLAFNLAPGLFAPAPPFRSASPAAPPWRWTVFDAHGRPVGTAATRAGARAAVRALYGAG